MWVKGCSRGDWGMIIAYFRLEHSVQELGLKGANPKNWQVKLSVHAVKMLERDPFALMTESLRIV